MDRRSDPAFDLCEHDAARLLPWLVNGRLDVDEAAQVEAHLATCALCRVELQEQRALHALLASERGIEPALQPSLQKLMTRIDELERELPTPPTATQDATGGSPANAHRVPQWLAAALVVQAVGLTWIGAALWHRQADDAERPASFRTLTADGPAAGTGPRLRVVLAPDATMDEVGKLLRAIDAVVVGGPSAYGAYTLELQRDAASRTSFDDRLALLRKDPRIVFAEPIVDATGDRR
jgi:Putative zinc-finger